MRNRGLTPAFGALAALVTFAIAAVAAPMVVSQEGTSDHAGPAGPRTVVASGASKHFGQWELTTSNTADGQPCVGVRFINPPPGTPALAEGCGTDVLNQVGTVAKAGHGTLFFGKVKANAASVVISDAGAQQKKDKDIKGKDGGSYVLAELDTNSPRSDVALEDATGQGLGRVDSDAVSKK